MREGDKNTKYFHTKALARKRKNRISGLEDGDEIWTEEAEDVERLFCKYFKNIFTITNPSQAQLDAALADLPEHVTAEMNSLLDQEFTEEEVSNALAQMCPTKAPGPDGLPAAFFSKALELNQRMSARYLSHILNGGGSIAPLNHTYIALIPKVQNPGKVTEFRPISLCYVIYRIVAKTIANRLKYILNDIISLT